MCRSSKKILKHAEIEAFLQKAFGLGAEKKIMANRPAKLALQNGCVRQFIRDGKLSHTALLNLQYRGSMALQDPWMQERIESDDLSVAYVAAIHDSPVSSALLNLGVRTLINDKHLTVAAVCRLTESASYALQDQGVQALISDGILSIEDVASIATQAASDGLQDQGVQTLINDKHLTVAAVCGLTDFASYALQDQGVQTLISDGILSIKDIASIATQAASYALQDQGVQTLIRASAQPDTLGIERLRRFIPMARSLEPKSEKIALGIYLEISRLNHIAKNKNSDAIIKTTYILAFFQWLV